MPAMPACAARYDVTLFDGICTGYSHGIPKRGTPLPQAILDYAEDREPDPFGDPGRLVGARFVAGETWEGRRVAECRPKGRQGGARFLIEGQGDRHWILSHDRRSLHWDWQEPDPPPDDDPDWVYPP